MDNTFKSLHMVYQKLSIAELADDPKKANIEWLTKNNPRMAIYLEGTDTENRPMTAYLVDGAGIRTNVWQDFVDGGNHGRYPWIPFNEYWLDIANAFILEYDYNLIHETVEDRYMQKGLDYDAAHSKHANKAEYDARHMDHIDSDKILTNLGWHIIWPEYNSGLKT